MLALRFPKSTLGAIVNVTVDPSADAAAAAGPSASGSIAVKMLLDTGAEQTALDESRIAQWGLFYVSAGFVNTMTGTKPVRLYELQLKLRAPDAPDSDDSWTVGPLVVMARPSFEGRPYAGVIGRDVLDRAVFTYDGPAHRCTIEIPDAS